MDPAKLKVVELRTELTKRGLDTKGNKAALVERLRRALKDEPADETVQKSESESSASEEETVRSSRRAKEKTPPRTPSRATRNAAAVAAAIVAPKTPTRSAVRSTARQTSKTQAKSDSSEDDEPPSKQQTKLPEEKAQEENRPQMRNPVVQLTSAKSADKLPAKGQEAPVKPQPSSEKVTATNQQKPVSQSPQKAQTPPKCVLQSPQKPEMQSPQKPVIQSPQKPVIQSPQKPVIQSPQKPAVQSPQKPVIQSPQKPVIQSPQKPVTSEKTEQKSTEDGASKMQQSPVKVGQSPVKTPSPSKTQVETEKPSDVKSPSKTSPMKAADQSDQLGQEKSVKDGESEVDKKGLTPCKEEVKHSVAKMVEPVKSPEKKQETSPMKVAENNTQKMDVDTPLGGATEARNDVTKEVDEQQDVEMKESKEETEVKNEDGAAGKVDRKRKRSPSPAQEEPVQQKKSDDEPEFNDENVILSWYDSDLNLQIDQNDFTSATPMHKDGFGMVWAGARALYGFNKGKVYYETKIVEHCPINLQDETCPHVLRVGWSTIDTSMQLGEERFSYGYDSTGKKTTECNFSDYGVEFGVGDVVVSYLDMSDAATVKMSFAVNGNNLGEAFVIDKNELGERALFPHVLSKNCTFACNFGQEEPWSESIIGSFVSVGKVDPKDRVAGPKRPVSKEECEMIMICGLPGSGKTFWCTKYASEHPEKKYNILGTSSLIEKMKVMGAPRKENYQGRWDTLLSLCTQALNTLLEKAYTRRRNYILDHHNVYPSAQKRKMRNFAGFVKKAVVIVPTEEEYKNRRQQREQTVGKEVPDSTVLEMKASFAAPEVGELVSSVEWPELNEQEAKKLIEQYNKEGKAAGFGQSMQHQGKRARMDLKDGRGQYNNRDHRRGGYQDRRNSSWRGGNNGGWRDNRQAGRGHMRHGSFPGGSGGWRPRGPPLAHRGDRIGVGADRRQGNDRSRPQTPRQGSWRPTGYQAQQGNWNQQGVWSGSQSQDWNQQGWGGNNQQWSSWKYGQSNYGANYSQNYDNGNYGGWNQQYYNQYWDQPQQSGQMATGSQANDPYVASGADMSM